MEQLGWRFNAIPPALTPLQAPANQISGILQTGEISAAQAPALLSSIVSLITAINNVASQPAGNFPAGLDVNAFKNEFPRQVVDYLIIDYLVRRQGGWGTLLKLGGIVRIEDIAASGTRPAFTRRTIAWEDLSQFFDDPTQVVQNAYRWGQADFRGLALLGNVSDVLEGWRIQYRFTDVADATLNAVTPGANPADVFTSSLRVPIFEQMISGFGGEAGLELLILPQTATELPGFAILPYASGDLQEEFPVADQVFVRARSQADFAGGIAIVIRPNKPIDVKVGFSGGTPGSASIQVSLALIARRPAGQEIVLIGSPNGSRLKVGGASLETGARIDSTGRKDFFVETQFSGAGIVIKAAPGEADSFLASFLSGDGFHIDFDLTLGVSTSQGFYFGGSGGLEINLPAHIQLGPVEIQAARIAVRFSDEGIPVEFTTTIKGDLGVLKAVVEHIGAKATFSFPPNRDGNIGPVNLALAFKPPTGVGLAVDAGVIKGGGFLSIDPERGEYSGALELTFSEVFSLTAIGLISTRNPDGSSGFSLLIIITADFGLGIQLGYGFVLLAVGGLLGLNRTMRLQALMEGIRTGAVQSIMFPQNVIANAPRIISDLRTIFPPQQGIFLIGPMAKIGWGTPPLISISLGIIIEIPGNIAILGVLKIAIPAEEIPLIVIQVNFAGAIEFDRKRIYFFAALFESRIIFITIEGEMGLLMAFGDDPNFVISVGGFHPRFNPPPLPFPSPRRIAVSLLNTPVSRVRIEGYFAITSNTVQFGARVEVFFGAGDVFNVQGHLAFDALFQFSPFYFLFEISASLSVRVFGVGLFSVGIRGSFDGPAPYHVRGQGSISLLFWDIDIPIEETWGESRNTELPPIPVMPIFLAEINKAENWQAQLPANNNLLVALRKLKPEENPLVLHPLGVLRISQRAVPLELKLDKVGTQKPGDVNRLSVVVSGPGLEKKDDAFEQFAPAQYQNFSDSDKLSRPAFAPERSGLNLSAAGASLRSSLMIKRKVRYEEIIIDNNFKRFKRRFTHFTGLLFTFFLGGNAATRCQISATSKKKLQPFDEKITVTAETYTVALQSNNAAFATDSVSFHSEASARDYMSRKVAEDPTLEDQIHVIPSFERAA
jgi:uncharacterized protein DUF6603